MKNLLLLLLTIALFQCTQQAADQADYVFMNVNVITMENDQVLPAHAVVVDAGQITRIAPAKTIDTSAYDHVIDGAGKYLVPGLAEMHAHIPHPEGPNDRIEETLFLYLSNGITTIRGMLGHPYHLELKTKVDSGSILGPRIYTSGPSLNGSTVTTVEEANQKVKAQKAAGYDFLKLHPGIKSDVFDEIVRTANEVEIDFAGHVSVDVGIVRALESGYASIDHVDGYLEGLVPKKAGVSPNQNGFFGYNFAHLADTSLLPRLIDLTRQNGVWVVTTQSLFTRWASPEPADTYLKQPEMDYMPASTLDSWAQRKTDMITGPDYSADQWAKMMAVRKLIISRLHETGLLLLGSDAPQVFNVPGFSIHHEMSDLLDCGLTPYEVLKTGTVNPALFFDQEGDFGSITVGASADMILIGGNPLEDLDHLQQPEGVMVRGQWLDRAFLDQQLEQVAGKATNL